MGGPAELIMGYFPKLQTTNWKGKNHATQALSQWVTGARNNKPDLGQTSAGECTVVAQIGFPFFQDKPCWLWWNWLWLNSPPLLVALFPNCTALHQPGFGGRLWNYSVILSAMHFISLSIECLLSVCGRPCARCQEHHSKQDWQVLCLQGTSRRVWGTESIHNYREWNNERSGVQCRDGE